jgi:hypothetical protein
MSRGSIAVARSSTFSQGDPPERLLPDPAPTSLGERHLERVGDALVGDLEGLGRRIPADAPELLAHDRRVLEPVAVGVDDRVAQAGAERPGLSRAVDEHGTLRSSGSLAQ